MRDNIKMKPPLDERIEEIASKYNFAPGVLGLKDGYNKPFLAMLDYYVSKTHSELPDPVRAIDIGCGEMRYAEGLIAFLEKYGKNNGEIRNVQLIGTDQHKISKNIFVKNESTNVYLVSKLLEDWSDMEEITEETGIDKFDFVTIFAPSIPPGHIKNYSNASRYMKNLIVGTLKPKMTDNGLLVISTSSGEPLRNQTLESLDIGDFDVLVNKRNNKFINKLPNLQYTYNDMIIARNRG